MVNRLEEIVLDDTQILWRDKDTPAQEDVTVRVERDLRIVESRITIPEQGWAARANLGPSCTAIHRIESWKTLGSEGAIEVKRRYSKDR